MVETRTITQYKVYKLILCRITDENGVCCIVAVSTNYQSILDLYNANKVDPYVDGGFTKYFKKGSPLEWFYPAPIGLNASVVSPVGIRDVWICEERYKELSQSNRYIFL